MNIKAVLLDMDGTLVNAFAPIISAMNQTLAEFGLETMTPEAIIRHTGRGDCGMTDLFGEFKDKATTHFLERHDAQLFDGIKALEGADELLNYLQENKLSVGIVTSKGQHRAEAQLKHLNWSSKIQTIIGKMDHRKAKPDPEPVLLACKDLHVSPEQAIMIGDGTADMKAGARAGSYNIGLQGSFSRDELQEAGAIICFSTLHEVQTWLTQQIH
ncbi:MAG: HAD family hydrolase [Mariprofundaceae bacterium]